MKRGKIDKKKEITKIRSKKTKNLITNKRIKEREPDIWKEMYSGLKLLGKKYKNFREKQEIKKQKEEQIRLKEQEEQRLQEQEQQKLQEQEERRLQKEQKLKEEKERRLEAREEKKLEEKRIKEEQQEGERQEHIYKERVARGERERLKQLEKVGQLRQEEKQLKEERELLIGEKKLKKESRLEEEQRPKEEGKRLNGKVKWFNGAKGYGFIEREGEEKDIFVHFSAVKKSGLKYLEKGEQLTFEIENSEKGPSATNLQKVTNLQQALIPFLKLVKKN
jgi:CspA family cold shock protein